MTLGEFLLYRMLIRTATPGGKRMLRRWAREADAGNEGALRRFQAEMKELFRRATRPEPPPPEVEEQT